MATTIATKRMAAQATFHCLLGCIIGELMLELGRLAGMDAHQVAFSGCVVVCQRLYRIDGAIAAGWPWFKAALCTVLAADTLSILTMVIVDNIIKLLVPGAMDKNPLTFGYWGWRAVSFSLAFLAAWPVNYWQLKRGQGHAITHQYHHGGSHQEHEHHHHHS